VILALYEPPAGLVTEARSQVVYDVGRGVAHLGPVRVEGPALVWTLGAEDQDFVAQGHEVLEPALRVEVELDPRQEWVVRCDRIDFPPGGVAHRHVHPGPGVRRLLHGELTIDSPDGVHTYRAGEAWFEGAEHPVLATASVTEDTAFVRVLLLPAEWAGKRTIRYLDPADEKKPKLQRATVLLEEPLSP
jgi:quercetin dioxygenase-like cupin family protein